MPGGKKKQPLLCANGLLQHGKNVQLYPPSGSDGAGPSARGGKTLWAMVGGGRGWKHWPVGPTGLLAPKITLGPGRQLRLTPTLCGHWTQHVHAVDTGTHPSWEGRQAASHCVPAHPSCVPAAMRTGVKNVPLRRNRNRRALNCVSDGWAKCSFSSVITLQFAATSLAF